MEALTWENLRVESGNRGLNRGELNGRNQVMEALTRENLRVGSCNWGLGPLKERWTESGNGGLGP